MKRAPVTPTQASRNGPAALTTGPSGSDAELPQPPNCEAPPSFFGKSEAAARPPIGACLVDSQGRILAADAVVMAWLGQPFAATETPLTRLDLLVPDMRLNGLVEQVLAGQPMAPLAVVVDAASGSQLPLAVQFTCLDGPIGPHVLVSFHVAAPDDAPTMLDALTGLPDRRALADRAAAWRRTSSAQPPRFAVLFLDLDDFKSVNDRHGHAVGDVVLQTLATRWANCIRDGDLAARYGGDEFVLLIRDAATPEEVEPVLRRLSEATQAPFVVDEIVLQLAATIGWATPSSPDWTIEAIIAAADADMYARKRPSTRST